MFNHTRIIHILAEKMQKYLPNQMHCFLLMVYAKLSIFRQQYTENAFYPLADN